MKVTATAIPDVLLIEPRVFGDVRGFFYESFNHRAFANATGLDVDFVQDNHSRSQQGVLRGLHYQIRQPQGKLVRVAVGEVFDVAVDLRRRSPTFGKWVGFLLSAENKLQMWVCMCQGKYRNAGRSQIVTVTHEKLSNRRAC